MRGIVCRNLTVNGCTWFISGVGTIRETTTLLKVKVASYAHGLFCTSDFDTNSQKDNV